MMHIIISPTDGKPIYEQIKEQIRAQVYSGELKEGEALPSIRTLARELRVGIITAKRAYDDLTAEGFLYAVPGKGVYVAEGNRELYDRRLEIIKKKLGELKEYAERNGVGRDELDALIKEAMEK